MELRSSGGGSRERRSVGGGTGRSTLSDSKSSRWSGKTHASDRPLVPCSSDASTAKSLIRGSQDTLRPTAASSPRSSQGDEPPESKASLAKLDSVSASYSKSFPYARGLMQREEGKSWRGGERRLLPERTAAGVSGGVPARVLGSEKERLSDSDMELNVSAPDEPEDIVIA